MVDIQTISIMVASAGVFAAAIYYIWQIRHQTKLRQTDLIMRLYSRFGSEGFQKAFQKFGTGEALSFHDTQEKFGLAPWVTVITFFEGIGVLLHRKLINIELVDDLFTSPVDMAWNRMKESIVEARKEYGQPTIAEWFEYLHNELKKREQRQ
jgi:hypothetical protein